MVLHALPSSSALASPPSTDLDCLESQIEPSTVADSVRIEMSQHNVQRGYGVEGLLCLLLGLATAGPASAALQQVCDPNWELQRILEQAALLVSQGSRRSAINDCYRLGDIYPTKVSKADLYGKERFWYEYAQTALAEAQYQQGLKSEEGKRYYTELARDQYLHYTDWYATLTVDDIDALRKDGKMRIHLVVRFLRECYRMLGEDSSVLEAFEKAAAMGPDTIDWVGANMWEQSLTAFPDGRTPKSPDELRRLITTNSQIRSHWESYAGFLKAAKQSATIDAQYRHDLERKAIRVETLLK